MPIEALISCAVDAANRLWNEWPTLTEAMQPAPSRWSGALPDLDVDYMEHEILGRPMTDEEAHEVSVAFCSEWARRADLTEEQAYGIKIDPVEQYGE